MRYTNAHIAEAYAVNSPSRASSGNIRTTKSRNRSSKTLRTSLLAVSFFVALPWLGDKKQQDEQEQQQQLDQ